MATPKTQETTTYLLQMKDGSQKKITVPKKWVLTFGALIPGSPNNMGKMGLRLREGSQQKAVFQDVESFRDMSIQIEERITTKKEETFFKGDGENRKAVVVEGTVHEWVNPDEPRPQKEEKLLKDLRVIEFD